MRFSVTAAFLGLTISGVSAAPVAEAGPEPNLGFLIKDWDICFGEKGYCWDKHGVRALPLAALHLAFLGHFTLTVCDQVVCKCPPKPPKCYSLYGLEGRPFPVSLWLPSTPSLEYPFI